MRERQRERDRDEESNNDKDNDLNPGTRVLIEMIYSKFFMLLRNLHN